MALATHPRPRRHLARNAGIGAAALTAYVLGYAVGLLISPALNGLLV